MTRGILLLMLLVVSVRPAAAYSPLPLPSTNASLLAGAIMNIDSFTLLGGTKAPKFSGPSGSSGLVLSLHSLDDHSVFSFGQHYVVLTTGSFLRAAATSWSAKASDVPPSYPDVVNSNMPKCAPALPVALTTYDQTLRDWMSAGQ
jgi:hypothetical protein